MMTFFIVIIIIMLGLGCIFLKSVKNVISYILEKIGVDGRTIEFIFSIIVIIIILSIFGII